MSQQAIQLTNISKNFSIPTEIRNTLVEHLSHPFQNTKLKKFEALKNINLTISKGEFIGIIGSNGSGKSTLLKIIAGIYLPTTGKVDVSGSMIPFLELGVGFNPELSGRENIFLNGIILGMSKKFITEHFAEIVEFSGIGEFLDLPLKNYSSGMKVRLAFSIAIMADADIYLLDEVLAVGDAAFQEKCFNIFKNYKQRGKTIVLVTHSSQNITMFCDRAVLIQSGEIIKEGKPNDVLNAYQ
jgi:ABC-2 type transport system ATP-binding protein